MPGHFFKHCPQCGTRHNGASAYCAAHVKNNAAFNERQKRALASKKNDPIWRLYNCTAWPRLIKHFEGSGNVICQRLVDGVRCTAPVEKRHHIISPRERPDLMYHVTAIEYNGMHLHSQIVGVCAQHHPVTEGEPKENLPHLAKIYVPSVWKEIKF
jgi:hypothetical protein